MKNILFLDIDLCLNHHTKDDDGTYRTCVENFIEDKLPICKDNFEALLKILDNVKDVGIVWSTSWRFDDCDDWNGWKNPYKFLCNHPNIKDKIIGKTPMKMSSNRFEEILLWFHENEFGKCNADKSWLKDKSVSNHFEFFAEPYFEIFNYAIIDDWSNHAMETVFKDHFFQCNATEGLTDKIANDIIDFLRTQNFNSKKIKT